MTKWTGEELNKIDSAEELDIAARQTDGTLRKPVTIRVIRLGDELYMRSYKGRGSGWFRGTLVSRNQEKKTWKSSLQVPTRSLRPNCGRHSRP